MRIFVAGASGAIGARLVPLLVKAGHVVTATTRTSAKAGALRAAGATPVVLDALDRDAVMAAVLRTKPEVVVHELTALPPRLDIRRFDREFALTNRLRTEGTAYLLDAARIAGARRIVAQSYAGWLYARDGGPVKSEDDPLDPTPPATMRQTLAAIRRLEAAVLGVPDLEGIVLRYGAFYGPGTSLGAGGAMVEELRRRRVPVVGNGAGVWSFLHIDDAAAATLAAIERAPPGLYNIVDDDPAPVAQWLPALAAALGAKPPFRVPAFVARVIIGAAGLSMMTQVRGASNAKAKHSFGWHPRHATWREGFVSAL